MILHLINKAPSHSALSDSLPFIKACDGIVLMDDGVYAVQHRHRDIGDNDIRFEPGGGRDQGPAILHNSNQLKTFPQQRGQAFSYYRVIVRQQDARQPSPP